MIEKEIKKLWECIKNNSKFLLINHVRMDPDAYWSLWAFYLLLKKIWKEVKAINDEETPPNFIFLSESKIIDTTFDKEFNPDIIISFDTASQEQLWNIYKENMSFFQSKPFIVIDHHITNPSYGNINIIDPVTSSACELCYEIIKTLWYEDLLDKTMSTLLLAWIHSDTNTFYNKNTAPKTLRIAANLIEKWAKNKEIMFELFRKKSIDKVRLWGTVLSDLKSYSKGQIVWVSIKKELYQNFGIKDQWLKWLINEFIANIEGGRVWFMIYEIGGNEVKASLRSNDDSIDVAKICGVFWWGWHKLASWFTYIGKIEDIEKSLIEEIKKAL